MRSLFETARLRPPCGSESAREATDLLVQEALGQVASDDVVMALWFLFNRANGLHWLIPGALPTRQRGTGGFRGTLGSGTWSGFRKDRAQRQDDLIAGNVG
jgi:hypothetical protein